MNRALVGRGVAAVGVVLGFVAIFVDFFDFQGVTEKYSDDGTILAFLLVALILTAMLLVAGVSGRDGLDMAAAVAGSAAFGFYLFVPAGLGFNHFDAVGTGGWLGICAGLIPLGLWYSLSSRPAVLNRLSPAMAVPIVVGRICCIVAIWLTAELGASYWNLIDKGRALSALMLLLVIGGAVLGIVTTFGPSTTRVTADGTLILAAVTFGLYEALLIGDAFDGFGGVGTGGWLGSAGAAVLLVGVARVWRAATRGAVARPATAAAAPPAA